MRILRSKREGTDYSDKSKVKMATPLPADVKNPMIIDLEGVVVESATVTPRSLLIMALRLRTTRIYRYPRLALILQGVLDGRQDKISQRLYSRAPFAQAARMGRSAILQQLTAIEGKSSGGSGGTLFQLNRHLSETRLVSIQFLDGNNFSDCLLGLAGSIKSLWCPPETDTR
jgi:hypothetical protein